MKAAPTASGIPIRVCPLPPGTQRTDAVLRTQRVRLKHELQGKQRSPGESLAHYQERLRQIARETSR